jgi:iron(III) transport system permease protein
MTSVSPDRPLLAEPVPAPSPSGRRGLPLGLTVAALPAALVALLPLVYLVVRTADAGWPRIADILVRERTVALVLRSLTLTGLVTAACLLIGVTLAVLVTRTDLPGRRVVAVLAPLPLAVPSYVFAFGWVGAFPGLAGLPGAVIVLTACSYPFVYLPVVAALRGLDPAQEEVSRSLGRGVMATVLHVTVRQVRPAAAAGSLLVALYVLSDFGAVSLLRYDVFTRVIHTSYRASFDRTPAAVLSLVLVTVTVALSLAESRARSGVEQARTGSGVARIGRPWALGRWGWPAQAFVAGTLGLALGFPLASLTYWMWRGQQVGVDLERLASSTVATVGVSALAAAVTVLVAVPVGVLAARHRGRVVRAIEVSTFAGHALPGIVVALSLVFFGIRVVPAFYQQLPLLVLAYAVLFLPAAVVAVRSSVALSSPRLEEVARALGQSPMQVLRSVTLPIAAPGVAAGAALVMLTAMKELPATLLLHPTGMDTLATSLWSHTGAGAFAAAAPYAAVLVAVAAVPTALLGRWTGRTR